MKSELKLHKLNHEISESEFDPGRDMKIQLPNYVEDIMAVCHSLPVGGLFLYRLRWSLKTVKDLYYQTLERITGDYPVREIESYIPPDDHIEFIYNEKTHILSMEIVTAYHRRCYRKISIIYTSPQKDKIDRRDKLLKSIIGSKET